MNEQTQGSNIVGSNTKTTDVPPLMAQHSQEFIKWQLENDEPIEKLEKRLLGMVYNYETKRYEPARRPLINADGAYWIICQVEALSDKITQLSNYTQDEIDAMMSEFEHIMISHLFSHYRDYELNFIADLESVKYIAKMMIFASLKRGLNAGTYRGLSIGMQHTEVVQEKQADKKGLFSYLKL